MQESTLPACMIFDIATHTHHTNTHHTHYTHGTHAIPTLYPFRITWRCHSPFDTHHNLCFTPYLWHESLPSACRANALLVSACLTSSMWWRFTFIYCSSLSKHSLKAQRETVVDSGRNPGHIFRLSQLPVIFVKVGHQRWIHPVVSCSWSLFTPRD